jgi:hypothetical protein
MGRIIVVGASAIALLLGIGVWAVLGGASQEPPPAPAFEGQYPDEWKVSLSEAKKLAAFPVVVPDHPAANEEDLTAVYVHPGGSTVAMQFPAPKESDVRQQYLEVFLVPWDGGDPADHFAEDIDKDPVIGKSILSVDGVPAEGTLANSPSDGDQANPAYLRFVYEGLEIQISGGDSLDLLIEVAETVVA